MRDESSPIADGTPGSLWHILGMRNCFSCVGLVVFLGCFMLVVVPDPEVQTVKIPDANLRSVIVLDPGHGGHDMGARALNGLYEKNLTMDVATRVERLLIAQGFQVIVTRRADRFLKLSERVHVGNTTQNSIFVSIHFNHAKNTQAAGLETYYTDRKEMPETPWSAFGYFSNPGPLPDPSGQLLANQIHSALIRRLDAFDRGVRNRAFYVVRNVYRPAVLLECGFLSNPLEAQLLTNSEYRDRIAEGITEGIVAYETERMQGRPAEDYAKK